MKKVSAQWKGFLADVQKMHELRGNRDEYNRLKALLTPALKLDKALALFLADELAEGDVKKWVTSFTRDKKQADESAQVAKYAQRHMSHLEAYFKALGWTPPAKAKK